VSVSVPWDIKALLDDGCQCGNIGYSHFNAMQTVAHSC